MSGDAIGPGRTAYLLTWNPRKWTWEDLTREAKIAQRKSNVAGRWSCGRTERIAPGDRFFLLKQGSDSPRGLMGSGRVTSEVYLADHWSGDGHPTHYVDIEFDVLLDPQRHELLDRHRLDEAPLDGVHWNTQSSGISIAADVLPVLEARWLAHLTAIGYRGVGTGEVVRNTAAGARAVLERILPDKGQRTDVLSAFADAMEQVHQIAPDCWSITLLKDRCRLIVGRSVGCTIHRGGLWMQLAREGMSLKDRTVLNNQPDWRWEGLDEGSATAAVLDHGYYQPVDPESITWNIVFQQNNRAMDLMVQTYHALHPASAPAYSPGVIAYLREELNRPLPTPSWVSARDAVD